MSDERLKTKLVAFGYNEDMVWTWERDELLNRFAEVILVGGKPKEPSVIDPELEKQRLAFEMKKWEQEVELQKQRMEMEAELERQKAEAERQKAETEQKEREQERELQRQRLEFDKQKAEMEHQQWLAEREEKKLKEEMEQKRHEEGLKMQHDKEKTLEQIQNDIAAQAKRYGDAIRGSIIAMGPDPLDATVFFKRAEQLFADYEIPQKFQAKVISPFLSVIARAVLAKLSRDVTNDYETMKAAILRELQLSSAPMSTLSVSIRVLKLVTRCLLNLHLNCVLCLIIILKAAMLINLKTCTIY